VKCYKISTKQKFLEITDRVSECKKKILYFVP
jgi:hypothetical protein